MNAEYWSGRSWIIILAIIPVCWPTDVEIIEARKPSKGLKMHTEFELALFTEMLGFVNDEHMHYGTAWNNILNQYQKYRVSETPYYARNIKITKQYFGDEDSKALLCHAYLQDSILQYNRFQYMDADPESYSYELKQVQLQYFSRPIELVKVVRCPVKFRGQTTQLYFQEIRHETVDYRHRGYFVFASLWTPENTFQPLELLMFVPGVYHLPGMPVETEEEADWSDATHWRMGNTPRIRLHRPFRLEGTHYFGKKTELLFLSKAYAFMDFLAKEWIIEGLVSILDRMKKDYEVDRFKMKEVRDDMDTKTTCINYIQNNDELVRMGISFTEDLVGDRISWNIKSALFPMTEILRMRNYRLLQCPVRSTGEYYTLPYLHILPVHYRDANKSPQLFTFTESPEDTNRVFPFILSPVDTTYFKAPQNIEPENTELISYHPGYTEGGPSHQNIEPGNIGTSFYSYNPSGSGAGPSSQNIDPGNIEPSFYSHYSGYTGVDPSDQDAEQEGWEPGSYPYQTGYDEAGYYPYGNIFE